MKNRTSTSRAWKDIVKPAPPPRTTRQRQSTDGIVVGRVASHTKKGVFYELYLDVHNTICCPCDGWYFRHVCSHLDDFRRTLVEGLAKKGGGRSKGRPVAKKIKR